MIGVGGAIGAEHVLVGGEGYCDGREGEVVLLVGKARGVKLVADEGGLELGEGVVAVPEGGRKVVGFAVCASAGTRVQKLVVPDDGVVVGGDTGIGFDGGDEVVESGFEGGEGVFGTQASPSAVSFVVEVHGDVGIGLTGFGEGLEEQVRRSEMRPSTWRLRIAFILAGSLVVQGMMRMPSAWRARTSTFGSVERSVASSGESTGVSAW